MKDFIDPLYEFFSHYVLSISLSFFDRDRVKFLIMSDSKTEEQYSLAMMKNIIII